MTLVREVIQQFKDEDGHLSGGLIAVGRGALYIEQDDRGFDFWLYPKGHQGSGRWESIAAEHIDQRLLRTGMDEFEAQLLLDYYLEGNDEDRNQF
ncbi:hypothetical protein CWO91_16755 [Bradyrhizobium genosp. SA-3]|uniref:hypothetical protein n=1 Tax=Bradyrhizobium genosp. SA-3 TaxID=508868 RepID=UPI001029561E|nr:hypothetical protein [Bradyrhizobium genosp. SA-3]RZN09678.1 hypothetical protein CWO91_16755 [Bradyrhizobium genosp. SA-3]